MSAPGVGPLTAVAYVTAVDEPSRFRRSKDLGPYLGLTPRRYQSGEVDRTGSISKYGDRITRGLLVVAASALLFRSKQPSSLKEWGLRLSRRTGTAKAKTAVARKLAAVLHRMWTTGSIFGFLRRHLVFAEIVFGFRASVQGVVLLGRRTASSRHSLGDKLRLIARITSGDSGGF
jgi:hypothetical protein